MCLGKVMRLWPRLRELQMVTYLSILIAHKLNIEAVHRRMSKLIQMSHSTRPSCHLSVGVDKRNFDLHLMHIGI